VRSLLPDPTGRFSRRHFTDINPPRGIRKHASKRCVVCMEKNDIRDTKYRHSDNSVSLYPDLTHTSRAITKQECK
jgi:hypothetical protein